MSGLSRFDSAVTTYEEAAHVQRIAVDALIKDLFTVVSKSPQNFENIFEFGCGTGLLTRKLLEHVHPQTFWVNDASPAMLEHCCRQLEKGVVLKRLPGNAEMSTWPSSLDLIASSNTVQWFRRPLDIVQKTAAALRRDGVLALTGFLPGTLEEVTSLTGIGLSYHDERAWQTALGEQFHIECFRILRHNLVLNSPRAVLQHLRATGVNGVAPHFFWTKKRLQAFEDNYWREFSVVGNRVRLTYVVWIAIARKKSY